MKGIYLAIQGQSVGPYPPDRVWTMLDRGEITRDTPAWYEGLADWTTVGQVLDALPAQVPPPAPPPPAPEGDAPAFGRRELREIARSQSLLMWAVLCGILGTLLVRMFPLLLPIALPILGFEIYALVRLGKALRISTVFIVLSCILLIAPCISLIVLVIFSIKASRVLKDAGIRVGLMGAREEDLP